MERPHSNGRLWQTALMLAAPLILPFVKDVALRGRVSEEKISGAVTKRARYMTQIARETIEDIVAEAQFERMKRRLDREIAKGDGDQK